MLGKLLPFVAALAVAGGLHWLMWASRGDRPQSKTTPLFAAVDRGDLSEVNRLLEGGADANEAVYMCGTPLDAAVLHCIREPRRTYRHPGATGLETQPVGTYLQIAKSLLSHGARLDGAGAALGGTAINDAAVVGLPALLEVLLADGRSADVRTWRGRTPLHFMGMTSYEPDSRSNPGLGYEDAVGTIRLLVKGGAELNGADPDGRTALHEAARWGRPTVVQALIACGADVNVRDCMGLTPLDCAQTVAIADILRKAGGKGLE